MDSDSDTPKGWVAPFGYPRINACSRLPVAFRSVPRPSSPPGAKASTECPSRARDQVRHAREQTLLHTRTARSSHASELPPLLGRITYPVRHATAPSRDAPDPIHPDKDQRPFGPSTTANKHAAQSRRHRSFAMKPLTSFSNFAAGGRANAATLRWARAPRPLRVQGQVPGGVEGQHPSLPYLVETIGFEPTTPCLQSRCSPS